MSLFPVFMSSDVCSVQAFYGCLWHMTGNCVSSFYSSGVAVENVYISAQQYKESGEDVEKRISKYDDSDSVGKYHTVDTNEWLEVDYWISDSKRIGVGRAYNGKEVTIFMQLGNEGKTVKCKNYKLFLKSNFVELRQLRGDNKYKEHIVQENGTIWVGESNIDHKFKVFVRRD